MSHDIVVNKPDSDYDNTNSDQSNIVVDKNIKNSDSKITYTTQSIKVATQIKRFKDIFEDQSISLEIAANKATQIMYANNDPILIDTILPDGQCNLSANYGPIICKSCRIGPLLRNGFCIFCRTMGPRAAEILLNKSILLCLKKVVILY